jgi:hypothetical protein
METYWMFILENPQTRLTGYSYTGCLKDWPDIIFGWRLVVFFMCWISKCCWIFDSDRDLLDVHLLDITLNEIDWIFAHCIQNSKDWWDIIGSKGDLLDIFIMIFPWTTLNGYCLLANRKIDWIRHSTEDLLRCLHTYCIFSWVRLIRYLYTGYLKDWQVIQFG